MVSAARPPPGCWRLHNGPCELHKAGIFLQARGGGGVGASWQLKASLPATENPTPAALIEAPWVGKLRWRARWRLSTLTPSPVILWLSVPSLGTLVGRKNESMPGKGRGGHGGLPTPGLGGQAGVGFWACGF